MQRRLGQSREYIQRTKCSKNGQDSKNQRCLHSRYVLNLSMVKSFSLLQASSLAMLRFKIDSALALFYVHAYVYVYLDLQIHGMRSVNFLFSSIPFVTKSVSDVLLCLYVITCLCVQYLSYIMHAMHLGVYLYH